MALFIQAVKQDDSGSYVFTVAGDKRDLHDLQYNLNPKPHQYTIDDGPISSMSISANDMSAILNKFAAL